MAKRKPAVTFMGMTPCEFFRSLAIDAYREAEVCDGIDCPDLAAESRRQGDWYAQKAREHFTVV